MNIHWKGEDILSRARVAWDRPNKFYVEIVNMGSEIEKILGYLQKDMLDFNSAIVNVNLFDITADPLESYINEKYRQAPGRIMSQAITFMLRDRNMGYHYRKFTQAMQELNREYPDDVAIDFRLYAEPSWNELQSTALCDLKQCILNVVGGITFDSEMRNQIRQFTATFKFPKITFLE